MAHRKRETTAATKGRNGRDRNGGDCNNGRNRNNGRDCNNGRDRNGDAKNVQKRPRSPKKTKSVQEHPRASKKVQERPSRAKTVVPEMYQELALLQEILDSINRHGSVGLASLPTAALIAQWSCFEQSREDALRELLRDIMRDVGADYALYDEVHDLQLSTKEAVDQALLKSENFRRAQAAQVAASEAKAKEMAATEAQAKAAAEEVAKEIAKEQAAHAAMAAAEVAKAISEAKDWFWIPEARETEATTAPPQLCNGERQRLFPPTLMFQQEPGDPPDVSVLSSKPKPQDSTQEVNIPSFETRFKETPDASVEDTGTLASATEGPKVVPLDVSVEGPGTLAPTVGGAKTRAFDAGTTIPRSSDAKSLEARQRGGKHVQAKHLGGNHVVQDRDLGGNHGFPSPGRWSKFSGLNLPLPRPPPEPVYITWVPSSRALPQPAPVPTSQPHFLLSPTSVNSQIIDLPYGWRNRDKHRKLRGFQDTYPDVTGKVNLTRSDTSKSPFSSPRPPGSWTTPRLDPDARGKFYSDFESISTSYTQMTARTEANRSRTTDFIISETTREAYKQTSVITMLLYIVLYHFVHLVIVLYNHVRVWGELCSEPHIV